jgi:ribosomal protein S25
LLSLSVDEFPTRKQEKNRAKEKKARQEDKKWEVKKKREELERARENSALNQIVKECRGWRGIGKHIY